MADVDWGQIVQIVGPLLANIQGESESKGSKAEELRLLREALAEYDSVESPEAQEVGPSAYAGMKTDPAYQQMQREALDQLQEVISSGGMTLADKANLAAVQQRTAMAEKSAREGIRDNMAQRGISGGGSELAMQLAAQQGAANRAGTEGLQTAADAQKRALDAMLARGRMAGDVRGQDFGEKSRAADAADAIAKYNAGSRGQAWNNQVNLAGARAGARRPVAGHYADQAQDQRAYWTGMGNTVAAGGRVYSAAQEDDGQSPPPLTRADDDYWDNPYDDKKKRGGA